MRNKAIWIAAPLAVFHFTVFFFVVTLSKKKNEIKYKLDYKFKRSGFVKNKPELLFAQFKVLRNWFIFFRFSSETDVKMSSDWQAKQLWKKENEMERQKNSKHFFNANSSEIYFLNFFSQIKSINKKKCALSKWTMEISQITTQHNDMNSKLETQLKPI